MTKKERQTIANRLQLMAERTGARVTIDEEPREITFTAAWPNVQTTAFIDHLAPMLHWSRADRPLSAAVFGDVNPYHKRKATTLCATWASLCAEFARLSVCVMNGDAFEREAA